MSATQRFIRYAWGLLGSRTAVPDATDPNGFVSYQQGYGPDYKRQKTDPLCKNIEQDKMNQLFYDLSLNQQQYQLNGVPEYVPAADNGGVAVTYAEGARVLYTDGFVYESIVSGNNVVPGTDATKWRRTVKSGGVASLTATGALPAYLSGATLAINSASATTQTLPAANTVAPGGEFLFLNINAGVGTVQRAGADTLRVNAGTVTAIALGAGDTLALRSDGVSTWYVVDGSAQLGSSTNFQRGSGYQRLPGGLILQWFAGSAGASGANFLNNFPIAFPTSVFEVIANHVGSDATVNIIVDGALSNTQVGLRSNFASSTPACMIIAVGN